MPQAACFIGGIIQHTPAAADSYTMANRIVILSDLHMGKTDAMVRSPKMLQPLWQGASGLVVNGDVAEVHDPRYQVKAAEDVLELHDLCESDRVDLTLLSGNHDPYISDIRHLLLHNKSVLITHGDALHPAIAPWCPSASLVREAHDKALSQLEPESRDELLGRLSVTQHAANEHWESYERSLQQSALHDILLRPWMVFQVLDYWRKVPQLAQSFVSQYAPKAKFFVFGHTHRQGVWRRGDLTLINTGSFGFPGRPRGVVIEGNTLSVYRIHGRNGAFHFEDSPLVQYNLPKANTTPDASNAA